MAFARHYVEKFGELFRGNSDIYGVHVPEKTVVEGQKAKGRSFTKHEALNQQALLKHLHGEESIGVVPLDSNGNVRFAAIDVDVYPLNPSHYLQLLVSAKLPLVGFRSKSGGLHLYCFFSEDSSAAKVRPLMDKIRQLLGLAKSTEIFPKQTRLVAGQNGNWINLPYFNFQDTARYAYDYDGNQLSLDEALSLCFSLRTTVKSLSECLEQVPMAEAPPCLQTLYMSGAVGEGNRNLFLFNCATYLKARFGKDFADKLHQLNGLLGAGLEYEELDRTIIASHNRGDYSYQCHEGVLAEFCDKEECGLRKYGKGTGAVSDLSFEQLIQYKCSTPYYKWFVNGVEMVFYNESELMSQTKFRELCLRLLYKVPNKLTDKAWGGILNRALKNIKIEDIEDNDDMSESSVWLTKVEEFFSRRKALRPSQIEEGLVWIDDTKQDMFFKGTKILEFLDKTNMFKHFKHSQHRDMLKKLGCTMSKLHYPEKGKSYRAWKLNLKEAQKHGACMQITANDVTEEFDEKDMKPLDFIGEEKY